MKKTSVDTRFCGGYAYDGEQAKSRSRRNLRARLQKRQHKRAYASWPICYYGKGIKQDHSKATKLCGKACNRRH